MSFWTETAMGREALAAWSMDRDFMRGEERRFADTDYCPVCGYLLAAHLIDACPTEAEVEAWWGR